MKDEPERHATPSNGVIEHGPESFHTVVARPAVYTLDVHTPEQRHIEGTDAFVPYDAIREHRDLLPDAGTPIAVYCRSDGMSQEVTGTLQEMGYTEIHHLRGGIRAWEDEDLPLSEYRFDEPGVRPDG
ncbi:rhodanese-like domain-containing protein [Halalkalicoccus jeotgali]|uniref:Rhodanese domain protein n=1 Tax=Halalkalicoccus jeotgali (strain DSM 18796 / CECT 7217 / JCM 14584 / KCTC 4019 / B3) TaxID=795797 RepID=D8J913_HALJB|nr:rhodanese-like domain-containing protein [Halalkalicoccus jeotgali]ADJ16282.1 Rhodanese domain protein [Halalkalicoccus jeotgali B3]ELY37016.1 Rhodanese domain-containing protein [Halalkalicoccus jeotgali B3]